MSRTCQLRSGQVKKAIIMILQCNRTVTKLVVSTFEIPQDMVKIKYFVELLDKTDFFLYYAETGLNLSTVEEYKQFLSSWVFNDGHCYISSLDENT